MSNGQEGYYQQAPGDQCYGSGIRMADYPLRTAPPPPPVLQGFDSQGRLLTVQAVQQWEYLQEEIPQTQWQVRLTELGAEGWELVMQYVNYKGGGVQEEDGVLYAVAGTPCWLCFFKRPKVTT